MDGGREEGLIMLFHMPLSRFSTIVVVILFFFSLLFFSSSLFLVWFFIVFYLASMIVTLGIDGLKMLFHILFSRFQQFVIVVFWTFAFCFCCCRWIRWKSNTLKYHELKHQGNCFMLDALHFYICREFPDKVASMFAMIELFFGIGEL